MTSTSPLTVQTPLFASNYPSNVRCTWFITNSDPGYIHVLFASFLGLETNNDFLDIGYGRNVSEASRVLHLSGTLAPNSLTMGSDLAWVRFMSNERYGWYGFELIIEWRESPGRVSDIRFLS